MRRLSAWLTAVPYSKRRASAKLKNIHVDYSLRRNSQELTDLNATDMDDPDERDIEAEVQKSAARGLNADVIFVYALDVESGACTLKDERRLLPAAPAAPIAPLAGPGRTVIM